MLPERDFNLRPRLNRLSPATPHPSTTLVRTCATLANLAVTAHDRLLLEPQRERDALGQRDELLHLTNIAPAPAPPLAPSPTLFDTYLVNPIAADPLADFPDLDHGKLKAHQRDDNRTKKEGEAYRKSVVYAHTQTKKLHKARARRLRRVDTVEISRGAPTALRASTTGWSGTRSGYGIHFDYAALLEEGVQFIPCDPDRALQLVSHDNYLLAYRSWGPPPATSEALNRFAARWNKAKRVKALSSVPSRRGSHRQTLVGTTRGYEKDLHLTATHAHAPDLVEELVDDDDLKTLSAFVSGIVEAQFPLVYERYVRADPGEGHPLRCRFGIFPLFCLNHASEESVHCCPHADWKNVAGGVCAVMAYGNFDSTKRSWLVFKDLKVAIELPHGHVALFPSSLLLHGNVDVIGADSEDAVKGKGSCRGSLVWFAQANYIVSQELGTTLTEAKRKGIPTTYEDLYKVLSVQQSM